LAWGHRFPWPDDIYAPRREILNQLEISYISRFSASLLKSITVDIVILFESILSGVYERSRVTTDLFAMLRIWNMSSAIAMIGSKNLDDRCSVGHQLTLSEWFARRLYRNVWAPHNNCQITMAKYRGYVKSWSWSNPHSSKS
jgi:hypothetical protein